MDVSGEQQSDVQHNVWKVKLDRDGKPLAESPQKHGANFIFLGFSRGRSAAM